jgi:hypothetical protein
MEDSKYMEDMGVDLQKKELVTSQCSNVCKGAGQAVAKMKQEPECSEDGIEHKEEEMPRIIQRKRAPKNKFKSDRLIRESKSLLMKKAMHEEASDEDKAWLASLSDAEVDLLVSIKQMAMERAKTIQDERVNGLFGFKVLRTIGILLKELIKERLKSVDFLGNAHETENILLRKHESHVSLGQGVSNYILEQDIVEAALQETMEGKKAKRKRDVLGEQMESELKKQRMAGEVNNVEILDS